MKLASLKAVFNSLELAGVRYLVAGGVAVVAHGYPRMTMDLDLVIQLNSDNIRAALNALGKLNYHPSVPVTADEFADAAKREQWIREKGMRVLNLFSDHHPETQVDLFAAEPFDFEQEYANALLVELGPGLVVPIVSIPALISMKREAGRNLDHEDIRQLQQILRESGNG